MKCRPRIKVVKCGSSRSECDFFMFAKMSTNIEPSCQLRRFFSESRLKIWCYWDQPCRCKMTEMFQVQNVMKFFWTFQLKLSTPASPVLLLSCFFVDRVDPKIYNVDERSTSFFSAGVEASFSLVSLLVLSTKLRLVENCWETLVLEAAWAREFSSSRNGQRRLAARNAVDRHAVLRTGKLWWQVPTQPRAQPRFSWRERRSWSANAPAEADENADQASMLPRWQTAPTHYLTFFLVLLFAASAVVSHKSYGLP